MAIDENDAFQVFNGIETMPEEMRPRAASLLADYKTQQESAGAPLWPTQEKIKQDRRKRVQEVFDNPLVLDADNGAFVEANKVKPGIGDNLRSREASILWLADRYNADEADVRKRYDFYKADQSQKWGHQTLDDATFFNKAKADNDAEIVRTDKRKQATLTGIESALSGASMASELGRFLEAYPDSTEEEKLTFASTLAQTTGVLAPHKRLIDSAAPAMRRIQKGEATDSDMQTVEELAWTLAQSQGRDRQILMRSLLMGAKKVAEEGGKRDVSGTFAGSALNLIEGMYGSGRRGEDVARRIDPSQPLPIGEPITSVQDALKAMDAMARADIASRVPYDPNAPELPASRVLSDEEKDFVIEAKDRVKSLFKTERELKKIALSTDPMDDSIMGTMASGSASSLSLMLPLAMGPQGLLMAGGGYANMEREELLTEFPDMDPGDASRIAVLSGAVQAAGDKAALFGLDKFAPNVRKMIVGGVTKEFIKKAAIQGTAVFVFENTVEAAQDLSTPVIQTMVADLKATVPQVDWQKERDEFLGTRADVAIGMVPLMLLGAGVNTAANKQQINQMLSDNDLLMRAGIIQEDRVKILELSTAGKTDEAQAWLKDSMGRRSPELAAEVAERYASKMEALRKTQDQAIALQTTLPEYTASVTRTPSGWQVTTGDGTIIPVESAEAARRIAVDLRQVGSQQEADALVNVIDGYYAAGKRVDTVFTGEDVKASETVGVVATRRDANNALLSQRQFGPQALETVRAEAEIAGIKSDTRNIFAHVNGSNEAFPMRVADGAKGVTRILNLYRSQEESQPQVITFLHENIESSWRLGMANGTFSEQETRTAFSALLPAFEGIQTTDALELQFIDNVRQLAAGKGNDTMMRETVSEMVVRDVLGRDRDGRATGMKPGSISRAIEASVMGANTQEQVSALKSILAAIKAFTAYLKAVFSTVDAISTARDEGKLGEDWIGFVDKVLGIDEVKRDEGLAMNEAQAILEDSDMPFSISPASTASVPTSDIDTIPEDLSRAEADMKAGGKDWAAKVDLSQPVGVYRGEDGRLKLFDGHHRWLAARERGEPLQVSESVIGRAVPIGEAPVVAEMPDGAQLVGPATFSITAYHGTPHKVDKFTTAKIGTGEGAQAYGWGLYFAAAKKVAEQYRKELSRIMVPDDVAAKSEVHKALAEMVNEGMDIGVAADKLRKFPWDQVREARDEIAKLPRSGNLYTVELLPDADDFLDWDKPLSEQSEKVKAALASTGLFTPRDLNPPANFVPSPLFNSGRGAYDILKSNEGSDEKASKLLASLGIAGMKYFDGNSRNIEFGTRNYVIFDESLVKILEENGQKVEGQSFSISPIRNLNELSDQVERQFAENPVEALEVKTKVIRQFTKIADKWSNERWTPQGNKIRPISDKRTVKSLDKEQAMRQAQREVELVNEGIDKLTPETLMAYSEGVGALEGDPLVDKMLNENGRLMSKATAAREGRNIKDQYDDLNWIPPQWYSNGKTIKTVVITRKDGSSESFPSAKVPAEVKAAIKSGEVKVKINKVTIPAVGGIMPDVMANNLGFDTASEMWAALESSIKSHRNAKEGYAKAEAAVKAVEKAAFEQARKEAQAWRDEADAMQKEDWSPKESLVRDLITLESIRAMFPQEIRDKIGGFVTLARKASESARLKVLQKQLERGQVLLEKHLKEQYGTATDKLLDRYKSQKDASGRITGKILSTATEQVDWAAAVMDMTLEQQSEKSDVLEKIIEEPKDGDDVQDALNRLGILRLFEVWDTKDSAAREAAFNWLAETIELGKQGKKILDEERKAFLTDMRQSAQSSILKGDKLNADVADEITNLNKGVLKSALLRMRGILSSSLWTTMQRLELIFGEDSKILNHFAEKIINAANLSTDIKRLVEAQKKEALSIIFNSDSKFAHARGIAELQKMKKSGISIRRVVKKEVKLDLETLTKLNDGTMSAETAGLRQDEADAALEEFANNGRKSSVTIEQVVDAGEPVERTMSETQGIQWWLWSMQDASRKQMERDGWDADSFAQLEKFLSPEAKALGRWISGSYQDAADLIEPVYRKLFNAPLPRTKNYSPIHRRNINTSGDIMDMDASDMNSGLAAGFVQARVNTTASLVESDALAVFLAQWENVSHWVSHAELMRDMKAVLLDKDTAVAIRQKKSEGYLQRLKEDIKTIESNGTNSAKELVDISRMWRWFMQFRAYKGLAFRISPIIKQTPALLNPLLADVPAHNYMMGMARAFMEPQTFAKEVSAMWSSDIIRRRIESGFSAESRVAIQGSSMTGSQAILAMQAGMMPMSMVDGGWTALGAAISFDYYRRGYMRDNPQMTPELADSAAIARVEKMIATSAQPSDVYARALYERSGNPFMRSMSMFVSDQRKTLAIELMAIRRLATGKSKNKALDVQRAIVAHVVMAGVSQVMAGVIASLLGDDEDRDRELSIEQWTLALALGPVNGLFGLGRLLDRAGRYFINSDFYQERFGTGQKLGMFPNDNLADKAFVDIYKAVTNMDDLFDPENPDDFMDELDNVSSAVGAAASAAFGPAGAVVDVGANIVREGRKAAKRMSD